MPDRAKHEERARRNSDLYRLLRRTQPQFTDWATTAPLCSGVHAADAFLYPAHSDNHSERFRASPARPLSPLGGSTSRRDSAAIGV